MRKNYFLLPFLLLIITPAHAAFEIEQEPAPTYLPYAPVAPVATPASTMPYQAASSNSSAQVSNQQIQPQQSAQQPVITPMQASRGEQAKKLLAEDAARAIGSNKTNNDVKAIEKQLGQMPDSFMMQTKGESFPLNGNGHNSPQAITQNTPVVPVEANPTKEQAAKDTSNTDMATPAIKSEVVDVIPTPKAEPLPSWNASAGDTLRKTVETWSSTEGWNVRWEAELLDYPIEENFSLIGKYLDVITRTFELYKDTKRPFRVEVYPTQKLVVVKEKK